MGYRFERRRYDGRRRAADASPLCRCHARRSARAHRVPVGLAELRSGPPRVPRPEPRSPCRCRPTSSGRRTHIGSCRRRGGCLLAAAAPRGSDHALSFLSRRSLRPVRARFVGDRVLSREHHSSGPVPVPDPRPVLRRISIAWVSSCSYRIDVADCRSSTFRCSVAGLGADRVVWRARPRPRRPLLSTQGCVAGAATSGVACVGVATRCTDLPVVLTWAWPGVRRRSSAWPSRHLPAPNADAVRSRCWAPEKPVARTLTVLCRCGVRVAGSSPRRDVSILGASAALPVIVAPSLSRRAARRRRPVPDHVSQRAIPHPEWRDR